jgi:hypothetical protein
MQRLKLTTVGAWCAILVLPVLIAGGTLLGRSGAADLLPATGAPGKDWLVAVASDSGFAGGGWLLIAMGFLVIVAFVGFYRFLASAGELLILAPTAGIVGMSLVQVSHLVPIAMAYELAPAYVQAGADKATLGSVSDTLAAVSQVTNAGGDALVWGVAVPLFAWAILATRALPRWVGWLGFVTAVFGGLLGLLAPLSSAVDGLSTIGFLAFFIFMLCMGITMLRRRSRVTSDTVSTEHVVRDADAAAGIAAE